MRKLLAMLLAAVLVACMPGALAEQVDPWAKYDTTVEVLCTKAVTVSGDQKDYTYENPFIDLVREKLGIQINYKWVTTPDQFNQKVALMLATGDLADVMVVDMTTMGQMVDAGMLADLTQVWDQYADDFTKEQMGYGAAPSFETGTFDGKLYGIPNVVPVLETMHGMFLRADWMKALGLEEPKSFADLEKILYAFAKQGEGYYGLGMNKDLYGNGYEMTSIANMMHAYPNAWIKNSEGKVVYGSVQPEMKAVLSKLAQWYADGLIDPEFTVKNSDKEAEMVIQGKLGAFTGVQWAQFMSNAVNTLWREDVKSDWKLYGIPGLSVDETPAKAIVYDNSRSFIVVRKDYAHPEVAVKLLNIMHKIGAGDSRDYFSTVEEFRNAWDYWGWMPLAPESVHGNVFKWVNVFKAIEEKDPSLVEYNFNALSLYNLQMHNLIDNDFRQSDDATLKDIASGQYATRFSGRMFGMATDFAAQGLLEYDQRGAIVTEAMIESLAQLQRMELETFTRIITGEGSIEEFDTFVEQWNALGGAQITDEMNVYYAAKAK